MLAWWRRLWAGLLLWPVALLAKWCAVVGESAPAGYVVLLVLAAAAAAVDSSVSRGWTRGDWNCRLVRSGRDPVLLEMGRL